MTVAFNALGRLTESVQSELRGAIEATLAESTFIGGSAVAAFETAWADYCGTRHAIGVGSGAHAIAIALRAKGIGAGDEVIAPANTCVPTVAGITSARATPVLADVDPRSLTLHPESVLAALTPRTRAIVPVHLYGRCADMDALSAIAVDNGLFLLEDAAHAHGATFQGRRAGSLGSAAAWSFYPTKNLGALGDAGAVTTDDDELRDRLVELRQFGRRGTVHLHRVAQTRLATIQAAALLAKLPHLESWNARRRALASRYDRGLAGAPIVKPEPDAGHAYHLYVVQSDHRDALQQRLLRDGVETAVHYSPPVHGHPAFAELGRPGRLDVSERAASRVLSLPLHPYLTDDEADEVIRCCVAA